VAVMAVNSCAQLDLVGDVETACRRESCW